MLYIVDRLFEDVFDMKMERVSLIIRFKTAFVMDKKRQTGLFFSLFVSFGGGKGIRTLVRLLSNGFQDRLVMTTSISLRKGIQFFASGKTLEKILERKFLSRCICPECLQIQGF